MQSVSGPVIGCSNRHDGVTVLTGFGRPFGIGQDRDGSLLIADMDVHGICRISQAQGYVQWLFDNQGWTERYDVQETVVKRGAKKWSPNRFNGPHSVSVLPTGRLCVVTYYQPGLHLFPEDGGPGMVVAGGDGPNRLVGPATGFLDRADRILVTDYGANSVAVFDQEAVFLGALGGGVNGFGSTIQNRPGGSAGMFDRPHMARMLPSGDILVADTWNHRLQRFNREGHWLGVLGGGEEGWRTDKVKCDPSDRLSGFNAPVAIGLAEDGRFVVTDWGNNRLQWFDENGRFLDARDDLALDRPYDAQLLGDRLYIANAHCGEVLVLPVS